MPDITMCKGGDCDIKDDCYRYRAVPNEYRQSWFMNPPFTRKFPDNTFDCRHFWGISSKPSGYYNLVPLENLTKKSETEPNKGGFEFL